LQAKRDGTEHKIADAETLRRRVNGLTEKSDFGGGKNDE
jgi:hypothetical protein